MEDTISLTPPWYEYVEKLKALFDKDPDIKIDFDEDELEVLFFVDNPLKAAALEELLPEIKNFGSIELYITIKPSNKTYSKADLFRILFTNNPVFSFFEKADDDAAMLPMNYCVFKNEVVQYPADNLGSYYGIESTLYETLAEEIFEGEHDGIYFCTDLP